jgi:hypothetical protein
MAKIIEFYVPSGFTRKGTKSVPPEQHGKLIPFDEPHKTVGLSKIIVLPSRAG